MNPNSKEAHQNIKPRLGLHHEQILSHMNKPGTCAEIGLRAGLTEYQVNRRMGELESRGLVKRNDKKFQYTGSDGKAYHKSIWQIVEQ